MNSPQSNEELARYLVGLAEDLRSRYQHDLAAKVLSASSFYGGSPSEFLHEAQVALIDVRSTGGSILSESQAKEITRVIHQIEIAFIKVGGA